MGALESKIITCSRSSEEEKRDEVGSSSSTSSRGGGGSRILSPSSDPLIHSIHESFRHDSVSKKRWTWKTGLEKRKAEDAAKRRTRRRGRAS